jgi:CRISPR/Cas system Type II protein with McrA/HNH and RuvC-like nuclease domain
MNIFKVLKFLLTSEHSHFISVDKPTYKRWKYLIILAVNLNKKYKSVEIFRKKFKVLEDFVVVGLKYSGKNVRRRTSGFAKEFIEQNKNATCIYCDSKLTLNNATADHIIPISDGGNNCQVNLVVCCKDCNNERGNLDFRYYMSKKNSKKLKYFI